MSVSNEFKNITKKIKQQNIKLSICDGELTVKEIHMMPVHIFNALPVWKLRKQRETIAKELKYSFDGQLFKTIMKQVEITVKNANEIKDKDINFQYGLFINNKFEYIDLGNYFIKDIEDSKKKDEITVTGYDRMIRFMKTFKQSELQLTYPCKMLKLVQKMCEVCGVELYSTDFYNADLDVEEDFFTAQELTYRDVLEKIAQATLTTAFIEDNKLNLYKVSNDAIEKIDKSYLTDLTIKEKFGPANVLVLGRGDVEDNIEETDEKSIAQNGRCEIRFDENEFIEFQREKVIKGMFEQIKGLEYYSFEASDVGVMWLKPCACIELGDKENSLYKSYYLKANVTINTGISSDIEAELLEATNTEYKVTTKEEKKTLKVERLAKKNEGLIQDIVKEVGDRTEKETSITQDIDSITSRVHKLEEFTTTTTGTNQIHLDETPKGEGYILELKVKGNTENFKYLTPSDILVPSDTLVPNGGHFTLVCDKQSRTSISSEAVEIDVILDNPLRNLGDVYDELNIIDGKTTVTRRIGVNNDSSLYVLDKETTETLQNVKLTTFEDNTYVYIKEFSGLEYTAKYIVKNEYSDKFITKLEADTKIEQKAESIDIGVNKKLESYSTTEEMNSAIQLKADSINSEVAKKVNETELGTKIEQNYEHVKVAWNQISEFIQMMIINNNASFAILDKNKNVMMTLDKKGQHFYKSDGTTVFGEMGIQAVDDNNYIAFSIPTDYNKSINDGMAWGVTTSSDGKFHPILYIKNFTMPPLNSGGCTGELQLDGCNLVLGGENGYIISNGIKIVPEALGGISFLSESDDVNLLTIINNSVMGQSINILNTISFYANKAGSNSLEIGTGANWYETCVLTDDGHINCGTLTCQKFYETSQESQKKNFEKFSAKAIDVLKGIDIYKYNFKNEKDTDKKHIGFVIGDKYNYSEEVTSNDNTGVDNYSFTSLCCKAIQEQQEQIEQLQEKEKQKDEIITNLIKRIETLKRR